MKWIIFFITVFAPYLCAGQNLKDIFLNLPNNYIGLDKAQRDSLINNFINGKNNYEYGVSKDKHYLIIYETKNGFLQFTGAYEGSTTLTYWNVSTGEKLVGIVKGSCGGACDNSIYFLLLKERRFYEQELIKIIPKLSFSDFMDIEKMKNDNIDIVNEKFLFDKYDLLYKLPSKGKNIVVESQYHEIEMDDRLKQYSLASKIELIWNDGRFLKGGTVE